MVRAAVNVREVAAPAARDEDFLADAVGVFEDGYPASAFARFCSTKQSGGAGSENESVKLAHQWNRVRSCRLCLGSLLRVNQKEEKNERFG
jgi:hypothetical protein